MTGAKRRVVKLLSTDGYMHDQLETLIILPQYLSVRLKSDAQCAAVRACRMHRPKSKKKRQMEQIERPCGKVDFN